MNRDVGERLKECFNIYKERLKDISIEMIDDVFLDSKLNIDEDSQSMMCGSHCTWQLYASNLGLQVVKISPFGTGHYGISSVPLHVVEALVSSGRLNVFIKKVDDVLKSVVDGIPPERYRMGKYSISGTYHNGYGVIKCEDSISWRKYGILLSEWNAGKRPHNWKA